MTARTVLTIAGLWLEQHPHLAPDVPPEARAGWDALLDRVLLRLRIGQADWPTRLPDVVR